MFQLVTLLKATKAKRLAACSWFLSYLSQRKQVVKIEDSLSEPLPLKAGVPQGSILGPALFTLYVNDLLQVPKYYRALGYVDDPKVFMALPSSQLPEAVAAVNQDLRDIQLVLRSFSINQP